MFLFILRQNDLMTDAHHLIIISTVYLSDEIIVVSLDSDANFRKMDTVVKLDSVSFVIFLSNIYIRNVYSNLKLSHLLFF